MEDSGRDNRVEAWFLGVLALVVFGVVIFAAVTTQFGNSAASQGNNSNGSNVVTVSTTSGGYSRQVSSNGNNQDIICQCYNSGFELAGQKVGIQSTSYRTGFTQCRTLGSVADGEKGSADAGNAWSAGWEARKSGRTFDATCRAYKRRNR